MKTFIEFVEHKSFEKVVVECANLMVEMDVDPSEYILNYVSKDPEAEKCLLEYIEIQEGLWDSVKDLGSRIGGAAKAIGGSLWSGGGLKYGLQQAKDVMSGPSSKFNHALKVMDDLVKALEKGYTDPNTKQVVSFDKIPAGGSYGSRSGDSIVTWIKKLREELKSQASQVPKLKPTNVQAPEMAPRGPAAAPAAAPVAAAPSPGASAAPATPAAAST